ncbi:hypothetical protein CR513_07741, partial [Mucuna pruriens]
MNFEKQLDLRIAARNPFPQTRIGHTMETCTRNQGFPPNYSMKNNSSIVNYLANDGVEHNEEEVNIEVASQKSTHSFTYEQYEKLISLIEHLGMTTRQGLVTTNQDPNSQRMIGSGKQVEGLYHLVVDAQGTELPNAHAMREELDSLEQNGTWKTVDPPSHVKPIWSKWVYKVKHQADGSIERFKSRLVAKAKLTIVPMILALALIHNWHLHQLDVNNAFLHADLNEDIYMTIPQGVSCINGNQACKLLKSLYGFEQANQKWYGKLTSMLLVHGYTQAASDHSLFVKSHGPWHNIIASRILLALLLKLKTLAYYFLGLEVAHSKMGISICQCKYCVYLRADSSFTGAKPAKTLLDPSIKLHHDGGKSYANLQVTCAKIPVLYSDSRRALHIATIPRQEILQETQGWMRLCEFQVLGVALAEFEVKCTTGHLEF